MKVENNLKEIPYKEEKKSIFGKKTYVRYQTPGTKEMLENTYNQDVLASFRNVDITYGSGSKEFKAVSDLNLNIYKGEVLGLVGESGSGKSTTGKALVGLVPYKFGEIRLLNQVLPKKMSRGLKFGKELEEYKKIENFMINKVQMIFQDPANSLNPHVNVETVVSEGLVNTKNAREIYLFNFDQDVQKETFNLIPKKYKEKYDSAYFKALDEKVSDNSDIAFDALYVDFYKELESVKELKKAFEYLKEKKAEREVISKHNEVECRKILVREILHSVGLDDSVLSRYPLEFSGGQQQRIGISRSVVLRPSLLVADEPISALDVSIQAQVVNIFNDLKEKYNLTILFIAHDLRMVEYISDRIAVLYKGVLLEIGPTKEIVNNSIHPYTKSLLEAVPSIESKKGSLIGFVYNAAMHGYDDQRQPQWNDLGNGHFVLATKDEVEKWLKNDYSSYEK